MFIAVAAALLILASTVQPPHKPTEAISGAPVCARWLDNGTVVEGPEVCYTKGDGR